MNRAWLAMMQLSMGMWTTWPHSYAQELWLCRGVMTSMTLRYGHIACLLVALCFSISALRNNLMGFGDRLQIPPNIGRVFGEAKASLVQQHSPLNTKSQHRRMQI